jgi:hypothetical protein
MSRTANTNCASGGLNAGTIKEIIMTAPSTTSKSVKAAPAKPAPTKAAKAETAPAVAEKAETKTYEATARCGRTNRRESTTPLLFAVDVKDEQHTNRSIRAGAIVKFFASEASAQKYADKANASGADALVVPVTVVA